MLRRERARLVTASSAVLCSAMLYGVACDGAPADPMDGSSGTDAGPRPRVDAPFFRPDANLRDGNVVVIDPGSCGLDSPAFCDTFEAGPSDGGRSGELDPALWSVTRAGPWQHANHDETFPIGPSLVGPCRAGLGEVALPDADALICDPTPQVRSHHLVTATAAQNYGLHVHRIRRPFDFAERTGILKVDVDLSNGGLHGWSAIAISEDPALAPSFDWEERGSGPRNGFSIEFVGGGGCGGAAIARPFIYEFRDYLQTIHRPEDVCDGSVDVVTSPGFLNHVEVYLTQHRVEVWASDYSADGGETFPNFHMLYALDIELPFNRAYVDLIGRNHATIKYWGGSAWIGRWDNVGFDGPVVSNWRDYSAEDRVAVTNTVEGCMYEGRCEWIGRVIADNPSGREGVCGDGCAYAGEGRAVGYVIPRSNEEPVSVEIRNVDVDGATRARLAIAATYPWFEWNGTFPPPTAINLRYRLNGNAWHDRFITETEANAFIDFSPDLGGAGGGAGLVNQIVDIDVSELVDGTNTIELQTDGTWTGDYRAAVAAIDLLLTTE